MRKFAEFMESDSLLRLGWILIHSLWMLALLGAGTLFLMRLLKNRSAQARYSCGYLGLLLMFLTPVVAWFLVAFPQDELPTHLASDITAKDGFFGDALESKRLFGNAGGCYSLASL